MALQEQGAVVGPLLAFDAASSTRYQHISFSRHLGGTKGVVVGHYRVDHPIRRLRRWLLSMSPLPRRGNDPSSVSETAGVWMPHIDEAMCGARR